MQDNRPRSLVQSSLGYAMVRAFRIVNRASNRALAPFELSAEQAHILLILWFEGPIKIGELQRVLALGSGTLTGALDRLAKVGLVRRVPDEDDKRAFRVEAGAFDARKKAKVKKTLEDMEEQAFGALNAPERKELLRLLTKVADGSTAPP